MVKKIKVIGILLGLLYACTCLGMYLLQERMIFDPHYLPEDYEFRTGEEVEIEVEENIFLNNIWI